MSLLCVVSLSTLILWSRNIAQALYFSTQNALTQTRISYLFIPAYWSHASVQCHSNEVSHVLLISIYRNVNIHLHAQLLDYRQHLCILTVGGLMGPAAVPNSRTKNQFPLLLGSTIHTELLHRYSPVVALCDIRLYV